MIDPLEKQALDFIGTIVPASKKKRYILVCIDYVTKWVESKALFCANERSVVDFLFEYFFNHFGVPREIVTEQGVLFTSKLLYTITKQ